MSDGKWYKNAVIKDKTGDWFLCFDDNDSPEIVIKEDKRLSQKECVNLIYKILQEANIKAQVTHTLRSYSGRIFDGKFYSAISGFLRITDKINIDKLIVKHDGVYYDYEPKQGGIYYDF